MIDNFSLALTHGLMLLALWRLLMRHDLNHEPHPHDEELERMRAERARRHAGADDPGA